MPSPSGEIQNAGLDETAFQALPASDSGAFLPWDDATSDVRQEYSQVGLRNDPTRPDRRRIARVVTLSRGTRLFKASHYPEKWSRPMLSSWWSAAEPFEESELGAREVFQTALLNGVTLRDLVRFISAVPLDWNLLDWYIEVVLTVDINSFWGQFTPQNSIQKAAPDDTSVVERPAPGGEDEYVTYESGDTAYLPDVLGGFGAWQLYIPDFDKNFIDPESIVNISATDDDALAAHFGI